jgi:hypothetical protein
MSANSILWMMLASQAAPTGPCPNLEGVWALGKGERIMVMEQNGCRLYGTVREPKNNVLHVRGFWTGRSWTMAATRVSAEGCGTTAWGSIRAGDANRMLINVRGTDGLCGEGGTTEARPSEVNFDMVYIRRIPPDPAAPK